MNLLNIKAIKQPSTNTASNNGISVVFQCAYESERERETETDKVGRERER